jgi:hypothetical protein
LEFEVFRLALRKEHHPGLDWGSRHEEPLPLGDDNARRTF